MWNMNRQISGSREKAKQDWTIGNIVKVGFLNLKITGIGTETSQYGHTVYCLESLKGDKRYKFSPHEGLEKVS